MVREIDEQLDRDHEREGGYGNFLPARRRTERTLVPKAAGVLQPMVPVKSDEDDEKVVREMPLDGQFDHEGEDLGGES